MVIRIFGWKSSGDWGHGDWTNSLGNVEEIPLEAEIVTSATNIESGQDIKGRLSVVKFLPYHHRVGCLLHRSI